MSPNPGPDLPASSPPRSRREAWGELLRGPFTVQSAALSGLFLLAAFYTLAVGRTFFLPIVLAVLLSFLLRPLVRGLKRLFIPHALGAGIILLALLGGVGFGAYELAAPAAQWFETAPQNLRKIERRLRDLKKPVQTVSQATEQMARMAQVGKNPVQTIAVQPASWGERLWSQTVDIATGAVVVLILLYFLLASGDRFLDKLARVVRGVEGERRGGKIARLIEREISSYLATITGINLVKGAVVWGITAWVGLPNPLLWGALAAALNYIPYLGPLSTMVILAGVGLLTFDDLGKAFLAPGLFFAFDLLEAYLITPLIMGKRFSLNTIMLFLGLTFWGWLWGIAGALLAVPILVVTRILCGHSRRLAWFGELLGE